MNVLTGLDPSGYRQSLNVREQDEDDGLLAGGLESDEEKYKNCDEFAFSCFKCGRKVVISGVFTGAVGIFRSTIELRSTVLNTYYCDKHIVRSSSNHSFSITKIL